MTRVSEPEPESCCFDDWVGHWERQTKRKEMANGVSRRLLDAIVAAGLDGRSVLDVGCGIGDLAIAALRRGALRAEGFDLSPRAIEGARRLARERGVADRATFAVGDGAHIELPAADVVVLNRVICCYPDADSLVERSLAATRHVYAFTAPASNGAMAWILRHWWSFTDAVMHRRKENSSGFRSYVHDLERVDERVRAAGFRRVRNERRRVIWQLAVYARA